MILFEITGANENNPIYQELAIANGARQYDFLRSIVSAALAVNKPFLSEHLLKALNFQAIACLHTNAGEYRPCQVVVGNHQPPEHYRVDALMEDFVNTINRWWETTDEVTLSAYVLWGLNFIHPFINGNGRTARAACYFVLCVKAGQWLPGTTILPELIRRERNRYVAALKEADEAARTTGSPNLASLHLLLSQLLAEQLGVPVPQPPEPPAANGG